MAICLSGKAQQLPEKQQILQQLRLANHYFMEKWPDAGKTIVTNRERPANIWTRAVYYEGLMALYEIDRSQRYIDYAYQWCEKHQWLPAWEHLTRNADNQCCGQTYIDLYRMSKQPIQIAGIKVNIDAMLTDASWIALFVMINPETIAAIPAKA